MASAFSLACSTAASPSILAASARDCASAFACPVLSTAALLACTSQHISQNRAHAAAVATTTMIRVGGWPGAVAGPCELSQPQPRQWFSVSSVDPSPPAPASLPHVYTHTHKQWHSLKCCQNPTILRKSKMRRIYRLVYVGFGLTVYCVNLSFITHRCPSVAVQK